MRRLIAVLLAVGLAAAGGCADEQQRAGGKLAVWAPTSLSYVLQRILEPKFERAHPGIDVVFTFGDDAGMARQLTAGAPADVFLASADAMGRIKGATPQLIARDHLAIAVGPENPFKIKGLADLAPRKVAVCVAAVSCGVVAQTALDRAGVKLTDRVEQPDVATALTKLTLGEVDAALVYQSDATAAIGQVDAVELPAVPLTDIMATVLPHAGNVSTAKDFVDFTASTQGRTAFGNTGFATP
jgi:molybdate transport system substrate-binding protein